MYKEKGGGFRVFSLLAAATTVGALSFVKLYERKSGTKRRR
jgi:hypothetical protein